jgi:hypothetical protein
MQGIRQLIHSEVRRMTRRILLRAVGPIAAVLITSSTVPAAEPFHGFFQPRGGEYYSPLHYWAPAAYKVKYQCFGPECRGCAVSVHSPGRPVEAAPIVVTPAPPPAKP